MESDEMLQMLDNLTITGHEDDLFRAVFGKLEDLDRRLQEIEGKTTKCRITDSGKLVRCVEASKNMDMGRPVFLTLEEFVEKLTNLRHTPCTDEEACAIFEEQAHRHGNVQRQVKGAPGEWEEVAPTFAAYGEPGLHVRLPASVLCAALPVLGCPDAEDPKVWTSYNPESYRVRTTGGDVLQLSGPEASTRQAAVALWNRWMRERFDVFYTS